MINFDDNNTLETLSSLTFSLEQIHYDIAQTLSRSGHEFFTDYYIAIPTFFGIGNILSNENKRFII